MTNRVRPTIALAVLLAVLGTGTIAYAMAAKHGRQPAANHAAARKDALWLLSQTPLPSGSTVVTPPRISAKLEMIEGDEAHVRGRARWRVPGPISTVFAWLKSHVPAGAKLSGTGYGGDNGVTTEMFVSYQWPAVAGVLGERILQLSITRASSTTSTLLADSQSDWIVPRSPSEVVPAGVRSIVVTATSDGGPPPVSLTVTSARKLRAIRSLIDGLGVSQPVIVMCPSLTDPRVITVRFEGADAHTLAVATYDDYRPWSAEGFAPCDPVAFSIRGRGQRALDPGYLVRDLDRILGRSLIGR